jgi:serine/threonine protein kinase
MHENIPGMFEYLVAMKSLHPTATADERRDFFSEAKIMQYLDHPHVLPVLGQVTKHFNGEHYIVLPYCENGNLLEYLILHTPTIDENQQITWAAQAADALTCVL